MDDYKSLDKLIGLNPDAPALSSILIDCKNLTRLDLLFTLSDVIGRILELVERESIISYKVGLVGNPQTLGDLPKFENVETIPEQFAPDRTIYVLTLRIDGRDIIRPANYQSWDEYFMYFFGIQMIGE